jgi:hypothetical protein
MTDAPRHYHVTLTIDAEGHEVADALFAAFSENGPFLAGSAVGITPEDGYVSVRFTDVSDDPTQGPTSVEHSTPGAEIIGALAGFSRHHSLTVAVIKALLTLAAMRETAGLPPRHELRIDVVPASPLPQDTVSQQHSEGAVSPIQAFGTQHDSD